MPRDFYLNREPYKTRFAEGLCVTCGQRPRITSRLCDICRETQKSRMADRQDELFKFREYAAKAALIEGIERWLA